MELINWITSNPPLLPLMLLATILPPPSHVLQIDSIFFQEREFSGQPTINRQVCQKHVLVSNVLSPKCPLLRFSVSKMSWLCKTPCPWNFLSLKCPVPNVLALWNVLSLKFPVSKCPGSVKRPVSEMSCGKNSFRYKCLSYKCFNCILFTVIKVLPKIGLNQMNEMANADLSTYSATLMVKSYIGTY